MRGMNGLKRKQLLKIAIVASLAAPTFMQANSVLAESSEKLEKLQDEKKKIEQECGDSKHRIIVAHAYYV